MLSVGTRIGAFEVLARLGAGGMGEVWRARDTRLQREVAIKVLPAALIGDSERRARFEREARVLASLNHPHIGALLALEDAAGVPALVLELVEGPTLAERIQREGALPLHETLRVARAIAEAMEYAHEHGVVHRDLKPANIKFTAEGSVKVLDFGLAKALAEDAGPGADPGITQSPTLTFSTHAGVLLGTAAYMAPEQARGRAVDRRADNWAFGVVLLEMLTGRTTFAGETVSDTIARILEREPDWGALPASTPPRLVDLLQRCLRKDARERLRDIGEARLALAAIAAGDLGVLGSAAAAPRGVAWPWVAVVVVAALAAGAVAATLWPRTPAATDGLRLSVDMPADLRLGNPNAAEDGRTLVASGRRDPAGSSNERMLYRRALTHSGWQPIPGTEGVRSWTIGREGRWLHLVLPIGTGTQRQRVVRLPVDGGAPPTDEFEFDDGVSTWEIAHDGRLVVVRRDNQAFAIMKPGESGPREWKPLRSPVQIRELWLESVLPDDRAALVTFGFYENRGWRSDAGVLDLTTGEVTTLVTNSASPRLSSDGLLLVGRENQILAVRFDPRSRRIQGVPVAVEEGVRTADPWGHAMSGIGPDGTLSYRPTGASPRGRRLRTLGRDGQWRDWSSATAHLIGPVTLAPGGDRAVATMLGPDGVTFELGVFERGQPSARRLFAASPEDISGPLFSTDGRRVLFTRNGVDSVAGIWEISLEGGAAGLPRRIRASDAARNEQLWPFSMSPEGSFVVLGRFTLAAASLVGLRLDSPGADLMTLAGGAERHDRGTISPDGRALAWLSDEGGRPEVQVARFEGGQLSPSRAAVTHDGAVGLAWATDGRSLLVTSASRELREYPVTADLSIGPPVVRARLGSEVFATQHFVPLADGSVLFPVRAEAEEGASRLDLVFAFTREARRRLEGAAGARR